MSELKIFIICVFTAFSMLFISAGYEGGKRAEYKAQIEIVKLKCEAAK